MDLPQPLSPSEQEFATRVIRSLQEELPLYIAKGHGPFLAAIYDPEHHLIAKAANTVVLDKCSHCHAEMNAIRLAEEKLGTYNLAPHHLSLYVTSEPCAMCLGGILWSGIRAVYYGVSSDRVEAITGFDEGYKPDWHSAFQKRGISVVGNIEQKLGEDVLKQYVLANHPIYRPQE